jgi:hypothetical protein
MALATACRCYLAGGHSTQVVVHDGTGLSVIAAQWCHRLPLLCVQLVRSHPSCPWSSLGVGGHNTCKTLLVAHSSHFRAVWRLQVIRTRLMWHSQHSRVQPPAADHFRAVCAAAQLTHTMMMEYLQTTSLAGAIEARLPGTDTAPIMPAVFSRKAYSMQVSLSRENLPG